MLAAIDHPLLIAAADAYWHGDRKKRARMEEGFRVTALLKRGTPRQKLRAYAEEGDPVKFFSEVFGYKLSPQQEQIVEVFQESDRVIVCAGTNIGKSDFGALWLSWCILPLSQLPDPLGDEDEPQGAVVLLPGPSHDQIRQTIWQRFHKLLGAAEKRGWNFKRMFDTVPRLKSVDWVLGPNHFVTPISPERRLDTDSSHAVSGRHSANFKAIIEEAAALQERVWSPLDAGLSGEGNQIVGLMNPDKGGQAGPASSRIESGEYRSLHLSCLDFPNVTERKTVIGGGAVSIKAVDAAIRAHCQDLGPSGLVTPDKNRHQFLWALPGKDEEERGPRSDGGPGMEGCEEHVFAPNASFIATKLGQFPHGFGSCPFDMVAWDDCVDLWREDIRARGPQWKLRPDGSGEDLVEATVHAIDRWGIDPAGEGPNPAMAAPVAGPTVRDLWSSVWEHCAPAGKIDASLIADLVARGVIERIYVGRLHPLADGGGAAVAQSAHRVCGSTPVVCDKGEGGKSAHDHMKSVHRMNVTSADFGAAPLPMMEGEIVPYNRRVQLALNLAQLVVWRLALLPPDATVRQAAQAQKIDPNHDLYREVPGERVKVKVTKLVAKRKIAVGNIKLDGFDAICLGVQSPDRGGIEMSTITY